MGISGEAVAVKKHGDTQGENSAPLAAGAGVHQDAERLAELGTEALIGDYQNRGKFQAELHEMEKDPAHMRLVAQELTNIKSVGEDKLPVDADVQTDGQGNVTGLTFNLSEELEKKVYKKDACPVPDPLKENGPCQKGEHDVAGRGPLAPRFQANVLLPDEQQVLTALKSAFASGSEAAVAQVINPYFGKNPQLLFRITETDSSVRPFTYNVVDNKLTKIYFPKPGSNQYLEFEPR